MKDPYLYPHTDVLKNLADIWDREMLSCMEAEYTSIRLAELVTGESVSRFDFHGKDWEVLKPRLEKSNNGSYWVNKISRNRERDNEVNKRLLFEDWTVIRFWGNEIKKDVEECVKVVEEAVWDVVFGEE